MTGLCTALGNQGFCLRPTLPGDTLCPDHRLHPPLYRQCEYYTLPGWRCLGITLRGQDHCFTHSPRNRRTRRKALPVLPRTRRQRAQVKWRVFRGLTESSTPAS